MAPPDWMDVRSLADGPGPKPRSLFDEPEEGGEPADARQAAPSQAAPKAAARTPRAPESAGAPKTDGEAGAHGVDLAGLNPEQRAAVVHGDGPMLILAGAGSGKTRVITRRVAWLVATGRATPQEILAITFTNKAAGEMRERVAAELPVQGMWIATFHAACARILRRDIEHLGVWTRDFTIYDTHDKNLLIKTITKDLGYDVQRFRPAALSSIISEVKTGRYARAEELMDPGGYDGFEDEVVAKVRARYEDVMRANNALDFDDLLVRTLEVFEAHPGVRDGYASRFRYVLVDEYQDTNRIQYLLTRHFAGWHGNLAVCGDPDQSIYGWRGADIRNILDFEEDFGLAGSASPSPGGSPQPAQAERVKVVKLERNYRSTDCILGAAQALIKHNRARKDKDLYTDRRAEEKIYVLECADEEDEANEIAARIHGLRQKGVTPDQIAIFYRVNFMQRALERALRLSGVPYQIVGGVEFYQRREIRDLISFLHLIVNPRDDVAFRRVVNVPARGIGDKSLETLGQWASERGVPLLEAARSEDARATIRGRARAGLAAFAGLFELLGDLADGPAALALDGVLEETDYLGWLGGLQDADAAGREDNVEELRAHATAYDEENAEGGLRGFLQDVALVSEVDGYDEEGAKVTLMTLHASKGLEFPVVFIPGLEEELLPHSLAMADHEDEEVGVEEERRLAYVGITRAEERLFLSHARTRRFFGESSWRSPSRFLEEIPAEFLEGAEELRASEPADLGAYEPPADSPELKVGDRVEHDHFGYGMVEAMQGSGINARVTVSFTTVGSKVLLVQYAKLKRVTA